MARLRLSESPNICNNSSSRATSDQLSYKTPNLRSLHSHPNKENSGSHHLETSMVELKVQKHHSGSGSRTKKRPRLNTNANFSSSFPEADLTIDSALEHGLDQVNECESREGEVRRPSLEKEIDSASSEHATKYFDPNQAISERRRVRKGLRNLNKEVQDSQNELLAPESTGIQNIISRANEYFHSVKQTSDATIDSRLLVTAGDLTYRKTSQIALGDGVQGVDVDEFVGKCVTFMRKQDTSETGDSMQQGHQKQTLEVGSEVETASDFDDALKWELLGMQACFLHNSRPPAPGFLLGPLSVQKGSKAIRSRRERLQRTAPVETVKPDELKATDMANAEKSDVKSICTKIHNRLGSIISTGQAKVEESYSETMSCEEYKGLLDQYNLASNGGVPLFRFILHPTSFGQTVENMFYVSFLIKDGAIGVDNDDAGMPVLHIASESQSKYVQRSNEEQVVSQSNRVKHQAVLKLDYEMWEELVTLLGIHECLIPDRTEDEAFLHVGTSQWYG